MNEVTSSIEQAIKDGGDVEVFVQTGPNDHANTDSLPLRFGVFFEKGNVVTVKNITSHVVQYIERKKQHRHRIEGDFCFHNNVYKNTTCILSDDLIEGRPYLITTWRNDQNTEYGLSKLMVRLRERGQITPDVLLDLHPSYEAGLIKSADDLVIALRLHDKINADLLEESYEKIKEEIWDLEQEIVNKDELIAELKKENEAKEIEIQQAKLKNQVPTPSEGKVLSKVLENQIVNGSNCTVLIFSDGSSKQMKIATWDKNNAVTEKAKGLIGREVVTTCWDPYYEPGKWSRMGYFKNIYLAAKLEDVEINA